MFKQLLFIALLPLTLAIITPEHFAGVYTLQHGDCPKQLSILVNSTTIPAPTILASNQSCNGTTLNLFKPTTKNGQSSFISFLLSAAVGEFYSTNIDSLTCGNYTYTGALFIMRPEEDLTIPTQSLSFFPKLNQTLPNGVVLSDEYIYIFVNSCVYKRKAPEDTGFVENIINSITECLPADAMVHTETGLIPMENLKIGTKVLSSSTEYTKIVAWTHRDTSSYARFVKMYFGNTSISVTPGHYVYTDGMPLPARKVKKGMMLKGLYGWVVVNDVQSVWKRGLYNPHTGTGDIVVDGVVISTYTEAVLPIMAHALLAPIRIGFDWFSDLIEGF